MGHSVVGLGTRVGAEVPAPAKSIDALRPFNPVRDRGIGSSMLPLIFSVDGTRCISPSTSSAEGRSCSSVTK